MPASLQRWMKEVARLTQSSRLGRAAQFIQQSLGGAPAAPDRAIVVEGTVSAPRPSFLVPGIPDDLDDLCARMLERTPARRATIDAVRLAVAESLPVI